VRGLLLLVIVIIVLLIYMYARRLVEAERALDVDHLEGVVHRERVVALGEQAQEVADVAAIGVESVTGRAALGAEGGKEVVERALGLHEPMLTDGRREAEAPRRRSTRGLPPRAAGIGRVASVAAGSVVRTLHTALGVEPATSARSPDRSP